MFQYWANDMAVFAWVEGHDGVPRGQTFKCPNQKCVIHRTNMKPIQLPLVVMDYPYVWLSTTTSNSFNPSEKYIVYVPNEPPP